MEVISWQNMTIFTEIILLLISQTQFHIVKGIINAFDHMELCFVINLTKDGNWAITRSPIFATVCVTFATGCVTFATTFLYQVASTCYLQKS